MRKNCIIQIYFYAHKMSNCTGLHSFIEKCLKQNLNFGWQLYFYSYLLSFNLLNFYSYKNKLNSKIIPVNLDGWDFIFKLFIC